MAEVGDLKCKIIEQKHDHPSLAGAIYCATACPDADDIPVSCDARCMDDHPEPCPHTTRCPCARPVTALRWEHYQAWLTARRRKQMGQSNAKRIHHHDWCPCPVCGRAMMIKSPVCRVCATAIIAHGGRAQYTMLRAGLLACDAAAIARAREVIEAL